MKTNFSLNSMRAVAKSVAGKQALQAPLSALAAVYKRDRWRAPLFVWVLISTISGIVILNVVPQQYRGNGIFGGLLLSFLVLFAMLSAKDASTNQDESDDRVAAEKVQLFDWVAGSYSGHITLFLLLAFVLFLVHPVQETKKETVCEFILQQNSETNKKPTDLIALHSSQEHGRREINKEVNKTQGASSIGAPTQSAASRSAKPAQRVPQKEREHTSAQKPSEMKVAQLPVHHHYFFTTPVHATQQQPPIVTPPRRTSHMRQAARPRPVPPHTAKIKPNNSQSRASVASRPVPHGSNWLGHALNPLHDIDNRAAAFSTNESADFGPYMAYLHRRLQRSWQPPGGNGGRTAMVSFVVHRNGYMSSLHLLRSCGNPSYDRSALEAVRGASPFRPLPPGAPEDVTIEFTFDYGVLSHG